MIDYNREIETIDGRPARCVCRDMKCTNGRKFIVLAGDDIEVAWDLDENGNSTGDVQRIRNKPRELISYVNVYPGSDRSAYASKEIANRFATPNRLACIRVVAKEGQFD